jgi:hypothetical protein
MINMDLHGVRHADVSNEVKRFLEDQWDKEEALQIITGNSSKMKELVVEVLDSYGLNPTEIYGSILVI